MDRESLEKIRQITKDKITASNFQDSNFIKEHENIKFNIKKIAIVACLFLVLTTTILFENDVRAFIKYYFGNDKINMAAENGYVEETNMNFIDTENTLTSDNEEGIKIDNVSVSVKIDEFLIDDINLSTNFSFKFDEKIKEFLDLDNLQYIFLPDLIIFDEENRILASDCGQKDFEEKCKQYNLDYDFNEYIVTSPRRSGNGINEHNKEENFVKSNINFETSYKPFPNSKELNFVFTKIRLEKYDGNIETFENEGNLASKSVILTGNWKINIKVPEKMYNRPSSSYEVISISEPEIKVSYAGATETGFKFNIVMQKETTDSDGKFPPLVQEYLDKLEILTDQKNSGQITQEQYEKEAHELQTTEKYETATRKFRRQTTMITTDYIDFEDDEEKSIDKITHITNSNGVNFKILNSSTSYIGNDKYLFSGAFDMTKQDATDELTVTLIYCGEPVEIKLKK